MESWQSPDVPALPGTGLPLRLYDTARQGVHPSTPDGIARMYVCGITPYDATHLGHAATMITFDLVNRVWRDNGLDVHYVQNVTDVDDPLFERAERDGEDWVALGMRETALFREDMEALRILAPRDYIGAVESIPQAVELIERLYESGAAYRIDDGTGDIYFPVSASPDFGYESNYDTETMRIFFAERGGDPDRAGKRDQLDPVLWRGKRDGEPSWPSSFGPGRPGWHIECSAIALSRLGDTIDVQGGGNDLIFPHHEMSAAHAEVATDATPFARHYVHAGMIGLNGEKMSKSLGNLLFVSRMRADGVHPASLRLGLLDTHYRADREWNDALFERAERRRERLEIALGADAGADAGTLLAEVRAALADDLDTPAALAAVDRWCDASIDGGGDHAGSPALAERVIDALLGVSVKK